jgi:hypothetical protein
MFSDIMKEVDLFDLEDAQAQRLNGNKTRVWRRSSLDPYFISFVCGESGTPSYMSRGVNHRVDDAERAAHPMILPAMSDERSVTGWGHESASTPRLLSKTNGDRVRTTTAESKPLLQRWMACGFIHQAYLQSRSVNSDQAACTN